ncbi:Glycosyl transferase family 2 [Butyrivibrio sp. ob235]|uniref:glycosyltransferase n=1 Tax=Butyrivibrio sp. ob235 TaxID=1761780 RepID=UPI0008D7AE93|nr:glycosyltransferase [Butyrivibrio sp. ob235]SEK63592.1 Glycosyl transferase family 2 [Butyrivibrio sp. ob235]
MEKYSVLMSVYTNEKSAFLKESIDSMLRQTAFPDQFVLVKDGPLTTELEAVINDYCEKYPGLFTIIELPENKGLGVALNEGLKVCRNELVARMDSDDISLSDRCEKELRIFEKNPELSIVSGHIGEFSNDPKKIVSVRDVPEKMEEIKRRMRTRSAFNHPAVMYRKSQVEINGGYGTQKRKQDHDLFSRMINHGCLAYNIQEIILLFRAGEDNLKRRKSWDNCKNYMIVQWGIFRRHECSLWDFLFVIMAQMFFSLAPIFVIDYLTKTMLRKSVK